MLDRLLEQLQAQGVHESSGHFTLALESARRKLAQFRLPSGAYLLKFVQAATRWGSSSCQFKIAREQIRVCLDTPWVVDPDLIARVATSTTTSSPHPGLDHLLIGLAAAQEASPRPTCWLWDDHTCARLLLDDEGLQVSFQPPLVDPPCPAGCLIELPRRREGLWSELKKAFRRGDEHAQLTEHAAHAPLSVSLDGLSLNRPYLPRLWATLAGSSLRLARRRIERDLVVAGAPGPHLIAVDQPRGRDVARVELQKAFYRWPLEEPAGYLLQVQGGEAAAYPRADEGGYRLGELGGSWFSADLPVFPFVVQGAYGWSAPAAAVRASLAVPDKGQGSGLIIPVRDGVKLAPKAADLGCPGAMALVSAVELDTDLSQLAILENEAYQKLVDELRGHFAEMLVAPLRSSP